MTVVGFNFTKILVEKKNPVKGEVNIKNNVSIEDIKESKVNVDSKKKALNISFKYTSKYNPDIAEIEIQGNTTYLADKDMAKEMMNKWKKEKKIKGDHLKAVMNHVLGRCNVEAVTLSKDVSLPAPIPLPKMK